ncbi:unnamed protein product [Prunus brigantina]
MSTTGREWHSVLRIFKVGHRNPASGSSRIAALLTKNGPLGALDSMARLNKAAAPSYLFKV